MKADLDWIEAQLAGLRTMLEGYEAWHGEGEPLYFAPVVPEDPAERRP